MRQFRKDFLWNGSVRSVWQHFPLAKSKNDIEKNEHFEKLQALFYIIIFWHELMIAKTISMPEKDSKNYIIWDSGDL